MRTSAGLGILWGQKPGWKQARRIGSIIVSLVVLCLIIAGVIGCGEKSSEEGKLPEIVSFQANLPANEGDPVSYTFEVKNASKIVLIEAGGTIKEIAGPSSGVYKGAATGQAPSAVLTSDNGTFDAVLEASNEQGTVKKTATLSDSAVLKEAPYQPPHTTSGYVDLPCPTDCGCMTLAEGLGLTPCGSVCSGPTQCQGPLASTPKYCYKIPVQPCGSDCICKDPHVMGPEWVRCSDNICGANPDRYCFREACPPSSGCRCLLDTDVASCNWTSCNNTFPCNNTGEPAKSCYSCPLGTECMTPTDAAAAIGWPFDTSDPSACKCSTPDEPDMYCYHRKIYQPCDNTTGCVCRPDWYFNDNCQGNLWPCSDNESVNECGPALPILAAPEIGHCYRCPVGCECFADNSTIRISDNYTVQCTLDDCTCRDTPDNDWHCYKRPST